MKSNYCFLFQYFTVSMLYKPPTLYPSNLHFLLRPELDACDSPEKYPQLFHVILDMEVEGVDKQKDLTPPWEQFPCKDLSPNVLFSCHQEHQDALAVAGTVGAITLNIDHVLDNPSVCGISQRTSAIPLLQFFGKKKNACKC